MYDSCGTTKPVAGKRSKQGQASSYLNTAMCETMVTGITANRLSKG
jgi:hypothetical protein